VDAVEAARKYEPPWFVDIRMRRNVRAPGFQAATFEKIVGNDRYRWMPSLGNRRIKTGSGPKVQINKPEAAEELLDLALAARKRRQRVIFFCSCGHRRECHRVEVGSLLLKAARRRNIDLTVAEWPGGTPRSIRHALTASEADRVLRGASSVRLGRGFPATQLLSLPWNSSIHFCSPKHSFWALADPACYKADQWCLPLPFGVEENRTPTALRKQGLRDRRDWKLEPRVTV
jgi:hypothetical protein